MIIHFPIDMKYNKIIYSNIFIIHNINILFIIINLIIQYINLKIFQYFYY